MNKENITFDDFLEIEKKLSIKYGLITEVEFVPKSTKMLKLTVEFGDEVRTVLTNIGNKFDDASILKNKTFPFIMNLEPMKIMGIESQAMIMVPTCNDGTITITPLIGTKLL